MSRRPPIGHPASSFLVRVFPGISITVIRDEVRHRHGGVHASDDMVEVVVIASVFIDWARHDECFRNQMSCTAVPVSYINLLPKDIVRELLHYAPFDYALREEVIFQLQNDLTRYPSALVASSEGQWETPSRVPRYGWGRWMKNHEHTLVRGEWTFAISKRCEQATARAVLKLSRRAIDDADTDEGYARMKRNKTDVHFSSRISKGTGGA